jgi:hypothetical protein
MRVAPLTLVATNDDKPTTTKVTLARRAIVANQLFLVAFLLVPMVRTCNYV